MHFFNRVAQRPRYNNNSVSHLSVCDPDFGFIIIGGSLDGNISLIWESSEGFESQMVERAHEDSVLAISC